MNMRDHEQEFERWTTDGKPGAKYWHVAKPTRGEILDKAKAIINGQRQDQYGNPEDSFKRIADLWNGYFAARGETTLVTPQDVAYLMVLFKLARQAGGAGKEDNLVDACGYLAIAADMDLDGMEHTLPRNATE
jgi:hypothetical protein